MDSTKKYCNAKVTIYFKGVNMFRYKMRNQKKQVCEVGIVTTVPNHALSIHVRYKTQLGHVWPAYSSRGDVLTFPYTSLRSMASLTISLDVQKSDPSMKESTAASDSADDSFDEVLDLSKEHNDSPICENVLFPIRVPEGKFYTEHQAKVDVVKGGGCEGKEHTDLVAAAIGNNDSVLKDEEKVLVLESEALDKRRYPEPTSVRIPLLAGFQYEVIVENEPHEADAMRRYESHFIHYYDALDQVDDPERLNVTIVPDKRLPDYPICTIPTSYFSDREIVWGTADSSKSGKTHH